MIDRARGSRDCLWGLLLDELFAVTRVFGIFVELVVHLALGQEGDADEDARDAEEEEAVIDGCEGLKLAEENNAAKDAPHVPMHVEHGHDIERVVALEALVDPVHLCYARDDQQERDVTK